MESILQDLLQRETTAFDEQINALKNWALWPVFEQKIKELKTECLYKSHIHGIAHIERVLLFGGLIAMENGCDEADTVLLLTACSYHDIGRIDDSKDDEHGSRSSSMLSDVIMLPPEDMRIVQAAIHAHSPNDEHMAQIIASYGVNDSDRAFYIAKMLKDADALDRVRVDDLNIEYLRFDASKKYKDFAQSLYDYYKYYLGY